MKSLDIKDLSFRYSEDGEFILQGINMHVDAGDFVCILGQSGCGKSTLLRLMAGLEEPTTGSIKFDNEEVTKTRIKSI